MSSLLDTDSRSIGPGTIIGGGIVILLIVGFFYLPQFLSFGGFAGEQLASQFINSRLEGALEAQPSPEQIDALLEPLALSSDGEIVSDPVADSSLPHTELTTVAEDAARVGEGDLQNASFQEGGDQAHCEVPEDGKVESDLLVPLEGPITWQDLQQPEVQALLEKTYNQSLDLVKRIDRKNIRSRFELNGFINTVARLRAGGEEQGDPEQALLHVDYADSEVSRAFVDERISRELKQEWQLISLAPIIREPLFLRKKEKLVDPYDPQMRLMDVEVLHDRARRGQAFSSAPVRVTIRGYIIGDDTARIEYYVGQRAWQTKPVGIRKPDRRNRRYFEIRNVTRLEGQVLTLVAVSKHGSEFQKHYNFFPRAKLFEPYKRKDGRYRYRVPYQPFDPRIDQAFLVHQARFTPEQLKMGLARGGSLVTESPIVSF